MALDKDGLEVLDPTPVAQTVKFQPRYSMFDRMREIIRREMSEAAQADGMESWDEANDFDVGDDFDPTTPYEEQFDPDGKSSFEGKPSDYIEETPVDQKKSKSKKGDGDDNPHEDPLSEDQDGE